MRTASHKPGSVLQEATGVTLYLRVMQSIRSKIGQGDWNVGERIPTIEQFAVEYGVGRVTIRQALRILIDEGILESTRGLGTFVSRTPNSAEKDNELRAAINNRLEFSDGESMKFLRRERRIPLPSQFRLNDRVHSHYIRILKTQSHRGEPYVLTDIAIAQRVYDRFPAGLERKEKLLKLLLKYGRVRLLNNRQEITLTFANEETAKLLRCSPMSALIRVRSWRHDENDRLVFATVSLYHGDQFIFDIYESDIGRINTLALPTVKSA